MNFIAQQILIPIHDTSAGNGKVVNISIISLPSIILLGIIIISLIGIVTNLG
jgi:hypothetical protein